MAEQDLKKSVIRGVMWRFAERFGTQAMQFVVGVVLARLLGPEVYGTIALLTIFIAISQVLVDCGFGAALIQRKEVSDSESSSVFYLSILFAVICYATLSFMSPVIAQFYHRPILVPVLRVLAINLIFNAINSVQNAFLARKMRFDFSFRIALTGTLASGIVGITLAYLGYGVWALVYSSLSSSLFTTVLCWKFIGWRPRLMFSLQAVRPLFTFSWKLLVSGLLESIFRNLYGLVIGRVYSPTDLAFYNKGQAMPRLLMDSINGTLGTVAFPALSKLQDERSALKRAMRSMMQVSTFFVMPIMAVLAATAEPTIRLLFGEQWLPSVIFVQIACISFALFPFHTINLQAIQAIGRSDVFLKLEILKKMCSLVSLVVVYKFGVVTFALVGALAIAPVSVVINAWPNRRLLSYSIREQVCDVLPTAIAAILVFLLIFPISFVGCATVVRSMAIIAMQVVIGFSAYGLWARYTEPEAFCSIVRQFSVMARIFAIRKNGN